MVGRKCIRNSVVSLVDAEGFSSEVRSLKLKGTVGHLVPLFIFKDEFPDSAVKHKQVYYEVPHVGFYFPFKSPHLVLNGN